MGSTTIVGPMNAGNMVLSIDWQIQFWPKCMETKTNILFIGEHFFTIKNKKKYE